MSALSDVVTSLNINNACFSASCIQISEETHRFIMDMDKKNLSYITKPRGEVVIKVSETI